MVAAGLPELPEGRRFSQVVLIGAVAGTIALSWVVAVNISHGLQVDCGYSRPVDITYLQQAGVVFVCGPLALLARLHGKSARQQRGDDGSVAGVAPPEGEPVQPAVPRHFFFYCFGFGALAFVANCSFTWALSVTRTSTAMTLEQTTAVFIALFSCLLLGERFGLLQLLGLVCAVSGGILTTRADLGADPAKAHETALGIGLVMITNTTAALYMVLFRKVFAKAAFGIEQLLAFSALKGASIAAVGWLVFLLPGMQSFEWPPSLVAWQYLVVSVVFQAAFDLSLIWAVVLVSPVAARLFILLGLPIALIVDFARGLSIVPERLVGVLLAVAGVTLFEVFAPARQASAHADESRGQQQQQLEAASRS
eukprot:TRINITY_DN23282_c0_g1_i1.p1 TRINITY_DN23282_c0_g1~~TRINITY_DN23282_c0_g1_i1.p1  ORF type:complete len:366 (-),score=78.87 TRINITY_DN23282_c0_g1_i1:291-1388(-)